MNNYQVDFTALKPADYRRKSSENEDRQMLSIESQRDENLRIATLHKLPKFVVEFEESKSAKKEFHRPGFTKLLKMIEDGLVDSIVCWKADRLARNMTEGGMIMDMLASGKLKAIITNSRVFYPWDNTMMLAIEFSQGKQYVKDLSTNVRRGNKTKAKNGLPSGNAFLGYKNITDSENRKVWTIDEMRFRLVKKLIQEFLKGTYSGNGIARYAQDILHLTTQAKKRQGGKIVSTSCVHRMLNNPLICGYFYNSGERFELDKSLPRLCTETEYMKIKRMLNSKNVAKSQKHEGLFTGILKSPKGETMSVDKKFQVICDCKEKITYLNVESCKYCDSKLKDLKNPKYLEYSYYYNVTRKKQKLPVKNIEESKIVKLLESEILNSLIVDKDIFEWAKKHVREVKDKELEENRSLVQSHNNRDVELEVRKVRVRELLIKGTLTDEEYKNEMNKITEAKAHKVLNTSDWYERVNSLLDLGVSWKKIFTQGSIKVKKETLLNLSTNLTWNEEKLFIHNEEWVNKFISASKLTNEVFQKYEPKNNAYLVRSEREKVALNMPLHPALLPIVDEVRTVFEVKNDITIHIPTFGSGPIITRKDTGNTVSIVL